MTALDDAFHKLERAKEHLSNFTQIIRESFDKKGFRTVIESYPYPKPAGTKDLRPWNMFTVSFLSVPTITKLDGLLMGEAIQNLRSALDYLAWALYIKSGIHLSEDLERKVAFPMITSNSADFWKRINKFIPNDPPDERTNERTFIERYQPYQLTDTGMFIGWLSTLSNTDKHRIIIPTPVLPLEGQIQIEYDRWGEIITTLDHYKIGQEVKEGTKISSFILAGNPPINKSPVRVDTNTIKLIAAFPEDLIRPRPPFEAVPMYSALNSIRDVCTEILNEAKKYF